MHSSKNRKINVNSEKLNTLIRKSYFAEISVTFYLEAAYLTFGEGTKISPECSEFSLVSVKSITAVHIQEFWGGSLIHQNNPVYLHLGVGKGTLRKSFKLGKCYSITLFICTNTISFISLQEGKENEKKQKISLV